MYIWPFFSLRIQAFYLGREPCVIWLLLRSAVLFHVPLLSDSSSTGLYIFLECSRFLHSLLLGTVGSLKQAYFPSLLQLSDISSTIPFFGKAFSPIFSRSQPLNSRSLWVSLSLQSALFCERFFLQNTYHILISFFLPSLLFWTKASG